MRKTLTRMAPRKSWIAALLNFIALGLGHLYIGRARRALMALLILYAFIFMLAPTGWCASPIGFCAGCLVAFVSGLFIILDAFFLAERNPHPPVRWYMKGYIYTAYAAFFIMTGCVMMEFRGDLFGAETLQFEGPSMDPTLLDGDDVLIDTRYYHQHSPVAGDIVVVRGLHGLTDMRRVKKASGTMVRLVADGKSLGPTDAPMDFTVPLSAIEGRVVAIFFSWDFKRIGMKVGQPALTKQRAF